MHDESLWQKIHDELQQLIHDTALIPLKSAIERLHPIASNRSLSEVTIVDLIKFLSQLSADVRSGKLPLDDLVSRFVTNTYQQPNWQANMVNQAQGHVFQFI